MKLWRHFTPEVPHRQEGVQYNCFFAPQYRPVSRPFRTYVTDFVVLFRAWFGGWSGIDIRLLVDAERKLDSRIIRTKPKCRNPADEVEVPGKLTQLTPVLW